MLKSTNLKSFAVLFLIVNFKVDNILCEKLCDRRYLNDKIRIDGKVVIVTGGSSGLGLETARDLAERGGKIYIASRDEKKGNGAAKRIRKSTGNNNVQFIKLDLGSLKSVREFSKTFHQIEERLDILINNAGTASAYHKTKDNLELNMAVNHLGHFLLTNLLLDLLKVSAPSRIIVVSSLAHHLGLITRDNFNSEMYFPGIFPAYSNTKLANILFTRELSRKLENTGVTVNSLDPGLSMSAIASNLPSICRIPFETLQQLIGRIPEHAAQTTIMLAVDLSVKNVSGKHFRDCIETQSSNTAKNGAIARWLWEYSAKLTNLYKQ